MIDATTVTVWLAAIVLLLLVLFLSGPNPPDKH